MKKVALLSAINTNYGTLLQAYATQKELQKLGVDSEIIYYTSNPINQFYRIFNFEFLKTKLKAVNIKIITIILYHNIYKKIQIRDEVFMKFRKNKLKMTSKIKDKDGLRRIIRNYKGVVLGSDQVWNPQNLEMNYYTMNFVPSNIPKIAYAPSFGVSSIPRKQIKRTKRYLERIQHISVRETAGAEIVKTIIGRSVPVVCDPTALLSIEQWDDLKSDRVFVQDKYVFCYFLGSNMQHRKFAKKMAKEKGLKIISIQHMDEFVKEDLGFGDVVPYDVDPADFVNLISNAEIILTDSFHGMMFSIYYRRPFYVFNYDTGLGASVNSRIDSIMNFLDIEDRRLSGDEEVIGYYEKTIDWDIIHRQLSDFRNKSEGYLINALKDEKLL